MGVCKHSHNATAAGIFFHFIVFCTRQILQNGVKGYYDDIFQD